MFTQGSKSADTPSQTAPTGAGRNSGEASVISADLKIVGDLHCAGDVQIKGTIEGDIRSRTVTIGEGAEVNGSIYGQAVHVSGLVKGQIEAPTVTVARSGKIVGDVVHESLAVEAGAHLEGQCRRLDSKAATGQASPPALKLGGTGQAAEPAKRAAGGTGS